MMSGAIVFLGGSIMFGAGAIADAVASASPANIHSTPAVGGMWVGGFLAGLGIGIFVISWIQARGARD
jgi:hypothetical protein